VSASGLSECKVYQVVLLIIIFKKLLYTRYYSLIYDEMNQDDSIWWYQPAQTNLIKENKNKNKRKRERAKGELSFC
jgi:hypothetical protein